MDNEELIEEVQTQLLGLDDEVSQSEIDDLGRRFSIPRIDPRVRRLIRSFAAKRVRIALVKRNLTRPQRIFAMKAKELPKQTLTDLRSKAAHIIDGERYIAYYVASATGTDELLRGSSTETVGVTNFDEGRMPTGANLLLSEVAIELANLAGTNVDAPEYTNLFDAGGLPSAFQNGEIEITAGGKVVLPKTPMARFFAVGGAAMVNNAGRRTVKLAAPKMIKQGEKVEVIIRKPDNGALFAANNSFIKVSLLGPETVGK